MDRWAPRWPARACASIDGCHRAAILGVSLLGRPDDSGTLLAVADGRDPARRDAHRDEHVLDGLSAPLAERQIVLACAALVTMAFDRDCDIGIAAQPISLPRQDLL